MRLVRACPFCGSHTTQIKVSEEGINYQAGELGQMYVKCNNCQARGPNIVATIDDGQGNGAHAKEALFRWNERDVGYPVFDGQDALLGYLSKRFINRKPVPFDIFAITVGDHPIADRSPSYLIASDTVEVVYLKWVRKGAVTDGKEFYGWALHATNNELGLFKLEEKQFRPWPYVHGEPL